MDAGADGLALRDDRRAIDRVETELDHIQALFYGRCRECGAPRTILGEAVPVPGPFGVRYAPLLRFPCSRSLRHAAWHDEGDPIHPEDGY